MVYSKLLSRSNMVDFEYIGEVSKKLHDFDVGYSDFVFK